MRLDEALSPRLVLAAAFLVLLVVAVALFGATGAGGQQATASSTVTKKVKKLTARVTALEEQLAQSKGDPGPPIGPASGDLTGSYPNPLITQNAVGPSEVLNPSRGISLPLGSFLGNGSAFTFTPSTTIPYFDVVTHHLFLIWDSNTLEAYTTFTIPPDYVSSPSVSIRAHKDGHSGVPETIGCDVQINNSAPIDSASITTTGAASTSYTLPLSSNYSPGDAVTVGFFVADNLGGGSFDDVVSVESMEFGYTATQ